LTDPSLRWKTVETEHFSIHFYEGEEEIARRLAGMAEEVYATLSGKFDARPWGRTQVVVVDNHDLANGFTTVIPYNLVVLRVVPPLSDSTLADYDDWLRELFIHEYTHVVHITDTRYPAKALKLLFGKLVAPNGLSPGWVTEGIATYFETAETNRGRGRSSFTDMLLRTDILKDRFLHLDQMAGTQYEWPAWQAQYLYGVGFWRYLAETYGEEKIAEFSHKYGASLWFFSLNNKAKRTFKKEGKGQSFYKLWREWKETLEQKYSRVREELEKEGLREGEPFLTPKKGESFSLVTFSPDGESVAYQANSIHHPQELRLRDLSSGRERVLLKKREIQQIGFSPDGTKLAVSNVGSHKRYNQFSDLHEITIESGKVKQLTKGKRARDPDFSPDGKKIVAVLQETGRAKLGVYDIETEEWKTVDEAFQFDHPRWLPDGRSVAVSIHAKGQRDLWIVDTLSGKRKRITSNIAIEDRPAVDHKNRTVYFSSDETGIPNLYRYDLKSGRIARVTNVLTGAFAPSVAPDGTVAFQYYNGKGFEIRKIDEGGMVGERFRGPVRRSQRIEATADGSRGSAEGGGDHATRGLAMEAREESRRNLETAVPPERKYNAFKRLFIPRYILPNAALIDGSLFLSATINNFDPIYRHFWFADVTYRSDNNFVGFDLGYTYNRYLTPFFVGFSDFSVNYGDVFGLGTDFFEERRRAYAGIAVPLSPHRLSFYYFFEDRSEQSGLPAGTTLSTLGRYAGFFAQYAYTKTSGTAARISPEEGRRFTLNFELTDSLLGASNTLEQQVVWGDARIYLKMPYANHHVLALRGAGGIAFGDQLLQGNFGLGGSIGEGPFTGTSTRVFTLRGLPLVTFSRDRAWVASAEYRMPLFRLQRGLGTLPLALNSAHIAFFADIGDAFNRGNPSFRPLLGVGGELRGDFIVGWHLPIMGRLGYGVILTNRGRIAGLTDSLTGADARNGVLILELGTSF
jgi:Tol biopolymer transport system component